LVDLKDLEISNFMPEAKSSENELFDRLQKKVGYVEWDALEEFILRNQHIWRPIRGHCFETWFDKLISLQGVKIESVGGDDTTDRILNGLKLQLKTPYKNGTIEGKQVAFAMHKTHGLEKRPHNLYKPKDFADFLVGLHPSGGVIICPNSKIPMDKKYPAYLSDPTYLPWKTQWFNRFDLLGLNLKEIPKFSDWKKNKFFPIIGKYTQLTDIEIIKTILKPENFRVLEQNLVGAIRELHFFAATKKEGINLKEPDKTAKGRGRIKVDFILPDKRTIQVKGRTKSLCKGNIIGVEVKGSHGRIPQRLYRKGDFDILVVVLDPGSIHLEFAKSNEKINKTGYNFVVVDTANLKIHERSKEWGSEYLKDIFYFDLSDYPINDFSLLKQKLVRS